MFLKSNQKDFDAFCELIKKSYSSSGYHNEAILKYIESNPAHDVNQKNTGGYTALQVSTSLCNSSIAVFKALLAVPEVNINAVTPDGMTPLLLAIKNEQTEKMALLLSMPGIDLNFQDRQGDLILHHPFLYTAVEAVGNLFKRDDILYDEPNRKGMTPLHIASMFGLTSIVEILLLRGADVNRQNHEGDTPLHLAVKHDHPNAGAVLLAQEAINITVLNDMHHSASWYAVQSKHPGFKALADKLTEVEPKPNVAVISLPFSERLNQIDYPETDIPRCFICPVSKGIMENPITLPSGIAYDRQSLQDYVNTNRNQSFACPITRAVFTSKEVSSIKRSVFIQDAIETFVKTQEDLSLQALEAASSQQTVDITAASAAGLLTFSASAAVDSENVNAHKDKRQKRTAFFDF
jgi:ankyrin repeat protein